MNVAFLQQNACLKAALNSNSNRFAIPAAGLCRLTYLLFLSFNSGAHSLYIYEISSATMPIARHPNHLFSE